MTNPQADPAAWQPPPLMPPARYATITRDLIRQLHHLNRQVHGIMANDLAGTAATREWQQLHCVTRLLDVAADTLRLADEGTARA